MEDEEGKKRDRPLLLVCGHCGYNDIDGYSLLEINFRNGFIGYVCRECNKDNSIKLHNPPPSLPKIGTGR